MELKKVLMNVVVNVPSLYNLQVYSFYRRQFKRYLRMRRIPNVQQEGEKEYLSKWGGVFSTVTVRLSPRVQSVRIAG